MKHKENPKALLNTTQLKTRPLYVVGLYRISDELDNKYVYASTAFAQELLDYPADQFSAIEFNAPRHTKESLWEQLPRKWNDRYQLLDQNDLNAAFYKMLKTENLAVYLIFTLVLVIALFNLVGALIMMIVDKRPQFSIFKAMGLAPHQIRQVFFLLGCLISIGGGVIGVFLASIIVLVQSNFSIIYVPGTGIAYPVLWESSNVFLVSATVFLLGGLASYWATRRVGQLAVQAN